MTVPDDFRDDHVFALGVLAKAAWRAGRSFVVLRALLIWLAAACSFRHGAAVVIGDPDGGSSVDGPSSSDGAAAVDAGADAPRQADLVQTTSSSASIGDAIYCGGTATSIDDAWYRLFRPADYGIAGDLSVTEVDFASESSFGETDVVVAIYAYSGAEGGTTLGPTGAELGEVAGAVPDDPSPQPLVAPVTADVPAGTEFVVEVSSTDTQNTQGIKLTWFHLGANGDGQSEPGYFASAACGESTPSSQAGHDFIISVRGTY